MFTCPFMMCIMIPMAEEEADQVTRDLLLVFAGPDALQRGFLKPEEAAAGVTRCFLG